MYSLVSAIEEGLDNNLLLSLISAKFVGKSLRKICDIFVAWNYLPVLNAGLTRIAKILENFCFPWQEIFELFRTTSTLLLIASEISLLGMVSSSRESSSAREPSEDPWLTNPCWIDNHLRKIQKPCRGEIYVCFLTVRAPAFQESPQIWGLGTAQRSLGSLQVFEMRAVRRKCETSITGMVMSFVHILSCFYVTFHQSYCIVKDAESFKIGDQNNF